MDYEENVREPIAYITQRMNGDRSLHNDQYEYAHRLEKVEKILASGIDPNVKDELGYTPLYYSVKYRDFDMCRLLVSNGADPNTPSVDGMTPLMYAVADDSFLIAKFLLKRGGDPYIKDSFGVNSVNLAKVSHNRNIRGLLEGFYFE